jgi:uncharacterized damage-inducible protein DinB
MSETFQEYGARMLSLSAGADPFDVLASTPATIAGWIAGRRPEDLQRQPAPGRWSVAEIVGHLADSEIVFAYRVRMILASPGTAIQAFDQDAWSRAQHADRSDPQRSLALFAAIRESMLPLLRGLNDEELDRYGMHTERGKESIRHLLALYAGHDRNHLAQIERLLT